MADEEKKYLINVEDNLDEYAKRAKEAEENVQKFIEANKDLLASGDRASEEYIKASAQLKVLQKNRTDATKTVENAVRVQKAEIGSYEQLYQAWKNAQTQLKLMPNAYTTNAKGVRVLSDEYMKQKKSVEDAKRSLDAFGKGVADNRLNVGNYSEAIQGAIGGLQQMPGIAGQAAGGVQKMGVAFKALLANPIVLVITAIVGAVTALMKVFKAFDPIIDRIQQLMKGLTAVFATVRDSIIGLVSGQKTLGETFRSLGDNIRSAYNEGVAWMKLQQELDDMNWLLIESEAKKKNQIDELILQSKDRTKTEQERIDLIDKALKIEEELFQERKAVADRERLIAEEAIISGRNLTDEQISQLREVGVAYAILLKDTKDITDEEVLNLANSVAKQEQVLNQSISLREKAINRQNVLLDKQEEERKKRQESQEKDAEKAKSKMEQAKADLQKELDNYKKFLSDQRKAELDAQQKKRDDQIKQYEWEREQRLINEENMLAIRELNNENLFDIERASLRMRQEQEIESARQTGADIELIKQKYLLAQRQIDQAETNSRLAIYQDFASQIAQIFGEQTAIGKLAGIAQATINTYRAASEALASYPPPFNYVAMATAIATGIANVKKIMAVKSGLPGDKTTGTVPTAISASQSVQRTFAQPVGSTIFTQPNFTQQQINALPNQSILTAQDIATAVSKLPAPIVTVEDINARVESNRKVEVRAVI